MNITQKSLFDDLINILTKFGRTDETRIDEDWVYNKFNEARAEMLKEAYRKTGTADPSWYQDLGMIDFHKVNFSDDINVQYCACHISKATLPLFIILDPTSDAGFTLISSCGKTKYYPYPMSMWMNIPPEHERSRFAYYTRMNTVVYVNKVEQKLRAYGVLFDPLDAKLINSAPVTSIVNGTSYKVKYGTIVYNGTAYEPNSTFTGGATTTFTGAGKVYLASQVSSWADTDPYPISADMARSLVIELAVKEFGIERQQIADVRNDSKDDATTNP